MRSASEQFSRPVKLARPVVAAIGAVALGLAQSATASAAVQTHGSVPMPPTSSGIGCDGGIGSVRVGCPDEPSFTFPGDGGPQRVSVVQSAGTAQASPPPSQPTTQHAASINARAHHSKRTHHGKRRHHGLHKGKHSKHGGR